MLAGKRPGETPCNRGRSSYNNVVRGSKLLPRTCFRNRRSLAGSSNRPEHVALEVEQLNQCLESIVAQSVLPTALGAQESKTSTKLGLKIGFRCKSRLWVCWHAESFTVKLAVSHALDELMPRRLDFECTGPQHRKAHVSILQYWKVLPERHAADTAAAPTLVVTLPAHLKSGSMLQGSTKRQVNGETSKQSSPLIETFQPVESSGW